MEQANTTFGTEIARHFRARISITAPDLHFPRNNLCCSPKYGHRHAKGACRLFLAFLAMTDVKGYRFFRYFIADMSALASPGQWLRIQSNLLFSHISFPALLKTCPRTLITKQNTRQPGDNAGEIAKERQRQQLDKYEGYDPLVDVYGAHTVRRYTS